MNLTMCAYYETNYFIFSLLLLLSTFSLAFGFTTACCLPSRYFEKSAFLGLLVGQEPRMSLWARSARFKSSLHRSFARPEVTAVCLLDRAARHRRHRYRHLLVFYSPFLYCKFASFKPNRIPNCFWESQLVFEVYSPVPNCRANSSLFNHSLVPAMRPILLILIRFFSCPALPDSPLRHFT